jgi:hypothetical protein
MQSMKPGKLVTNSHNSDECQVHKRTVDARPVAMFMLINRRIARETNMTCTQPVCECQQQSPGRPIMRGFVINNKKFLHN